MADFITAYNIVKKIEGGYINDPVDSGGETYKGVARKKHQSWKGWIIIDAEKKLNDFPKSLERNLALQQLVKVFFKDFFWDTLSLDKINNQLIANELFDTGVNMGVSIAGRFLQRSLNVSNRVGKDYPNLVVDGNVGPKTVETFNKHKRPDVIYKIMNCLQGERYVSICEEKESQERFLFGWMERVFEINF